MRPLILAVPVALAHLACSVDVQSRAPQGPEEAPGAPSVPSTPTTPSEPTKPAPSKPVVNAECTSNAECGSGTCVDKLCVFGPSCDTLTHGGNTCGPNGTASCCGAIPMAVGTKRVALDKYNITAGRMRKFIETTNGDVRSYIASAPPTGWDPAWTQFLPAGFEGPFNVWDQLGPAPLYEQISTGSRTMGCYLSGGGARTYWVPSAISEMYGDIPQAYAQDVLDEKSLNCTPGILFAAFCAWDGGRLPQPEEIDEAWGDDTFPWGNAPEPWNETFAPNGARDYANYSNNYENPTKIGTDVSVFVAPPGRFPKGNGRYGHADLVGNVWNMTGKVFTSGPYTPDPLRQWLEWTRGGAWEPGQNVPFVNVQLRGEPGFYPRFRAPAMRKYWAGGARCAHDL